MVAMFWIVAFGLFMTALGTMVWEFFRNDSRG
jgi:hypothetical protein